MAWTPLHYGNHLPRSKKCFNKNLWGLTASQCLFCQNITSEPKMQKHERNKKRLRWSLEIRPRYSISHHVVAISPRWLNTNLRPKNCNPTAVATLLFSSAKFCPTKSHIASLLLPYPIDRFMRRNAPPFLHLGLLQDQQKNTSPYHERMHGFIQSGIKRKARNASLHPYTSFHLKVCYPRFAPFPHSHQVGFWGFRTRSQKAMASSRAKKELQSARPGQ